MIKVVYWLSIATEFNDSGDLRQNRVFIDFFWSWVPLPLQPRLRVK